MCARRWKQEFPRAAQGGVGGLPPTMRVTRTPAPRPRAPPQAANLMVRECADWKEAGKLPASVM